MMPGSTSINTGRILRKPAKIVPALACPSSRAEKYSGPWEIWIGRGLDHVEVAGGHHRAKVFESAYTVETDEGKGTGAGDQDQRLNSIGVNDSRKPAGDRVNAGRDYKDDCSLPERPSRDALEDHAGGVKLHGNLRE